MSIRQAIETDVVKISSLVKSLAHFYLDAPENELPVWLSQTLTESAFSERISSESYKNYVYEKDMEIIGYISLKKPNHLYHLFVSERFQGKGIARLLWEHLKKNDPSASFFLRSSVYAIPVYKRFGFFESGDLGQKDGVSFQPMELTF